MAKIMIFEPYYGGHHTNYIEAIVDQISAVASEIIICTSPKHIFEKPFGTIAHFDTSLPQFHPRADIKTKFLIAFALRRAVRRHKPDLVISTTGDHELLPEALVRMLGIKLLPSGLKTIGITHHGYGGLARGWKNRFKDAVYTFAFRFSGRDRVFTVNPIVSNGLKKRGIPVDVLPDPVNRCIPMTKRDAREQLGLHPDGRYIGHIGATDQRKAIPELLQAFNAIRVPGDHLLLAGPINHGHKALIEAHYAASVADGSIIIFDQFLSIEQFSTFVSACDVLAPLNYPRAELSANFIKAIALQRPVLVDSFGYTGLMTSMFDIGVSCNVSNWRSVAEGITTSFDRYLKFSPNIVTENLAKFHSLENFGSALRKAVCELLAVHQEESPLTWSDLENFAKAE